MMYFRWEERLHGDVQGGTLRDGVVMWSVDLLDDSHGAPTPSILWRRTNKLSNKKLKSNEHIRIELVSTCQEIHFKKSEQKSLPTGAP